MASIQSSPTALPIPLGEPPQVLADTPLLLDFLLLYSPMTAKQHSPRFNYSARGYWAQKRIFADDLIHP